MGANKAPISHQNVEEALTLKTNELQGSKLPKDLRVMTTIPQTRRTSIDTPIERVKANPQRPERSFFVHPQWTSKLWWDIFGMIFLIYNIVVIPIRIAWDINLELDDPLFAWESFIDWFFVLDILVNFRTGIIIDGEICYDPKKIAISYVTSGWLFVDLVSSIPLDFFMTVTGGSNLNQLKMVRMLRLAKLAKLLQLLKSASFISDLLDKFPVSRYPVKMLSMVFSVSYLAHILGCANFFVAKMSDKDVGSGWGADDSSWVVYYQDMDDKGFNSQYIASVYWALTTITTVGFGDIIPMNNTERIWCMISMSLGAAAFGLIIGNISDFVTHQNAADALIDQKMTDINMYMQRRHVPAELCIEIRRYLRYQWSQKTAFDEEVILADLSTTLRSKLLQHVNEKVLQQVALFRHISNLFEGSYEHAAVMRNMIEDLISNMNPVMFNRDEIICQEGHLGTEMFFIMKGKVRVVTSTKFRPGISKTNLLSEMLYEEQERPEDYSVSLEKYDVHLATLHSGDHFGEIALLTGDDLGDFIDGEEHQGQYQELWETIHKTRFRTATCIAASNTCVLETIEAEPLHTALKRFDAMRVLLVKEATHRIEEMEFKKTQAGIITPKILKDSAENAKNSKTSDRKELSKMTSNRARMKSMEDNIASLQARSVQLFSQGLKQILMENRTRFDN